MNGPNNNSPGVNDKMKEEAVQKVRNFVNNWKSPEVT